jgi:hypothetical protein
MAHKFSQAAFILLLIQVAALFRILVASFFVDESHLLTTQLRFFQVSLVVFHNASLSSGDTFQTIPLNHLYHQGILNIHSKTEVSPAVTQASQAVGNFHSDKAFNHNISAVHNATFCKNFHLAQGSVANSTI